MTRSPRHPSLSARLAEGIGAHRRWGTILTTLPPIVHYTRDFRVQVTVYPPGTTSRQAALITAGQWSTSLPGTVIVAVTGIAVWFSSGVLWAGLAAAASVAILGLVLAHRSAPLRRASVVLHGRVTKRHPTFGTDLAAAIEMLEPLDLIDDPVLYERAWGQVFRTLQNR